MSKATFYEHFANKEECILALFDEAATRDHARDGAAPRAERRRRLRGARPRQRRRVPGDPRRSTRTRAQTLLVEIIGAGPRAAERRDAILDLFADGLMRDNARMAERFGAPRFASKDDAFAIIGAIVELVSRQLRTGVPARLRDARAGDRAPHPRAAAPATSARALQQIAAENVALPALPAARRVARGGRARSSGRRSPSDELLGPPGAGLRRPAARVLLLGLAPAAHGANRTGRVFTGDRSGDFLFASLHRTGFANQPTSVHADDGLALTDAWIAAAVRCAPPANKPHPRRARQLPAAGRVREIGDAPRRRASSSASGAFAWDAALRLRAALGHPAPKPRPRFGHDVLAIADGPLPLLGCFHPSQQNTFTGKLTEPMMDAVFARTRARSAGRSLRGLPLSRLLPRRPRLVPRRLRGRRRPPRSRRGRRSPPATTCCSARRPGRGKTLAAFLWGIDRLQPVRTPTARASSTSRR